MINSLPYDNDITLTSAQALAFSDGETLYLKNRNHEVLGAASRESLLNGLLIADHKAALQDAINQLELLQMTLCQGQDFLELSLQAQRGLTNMLESINKRLTAFPL